ASSHVADPVLQPFTKTTFDPAEYLNKQLPPLSLRKSSTIAASSTSTASLSELSGQTQTLLSQLNAHLTRLSTVLTQLTDDLLRSGGRLAYEVEVLRGETIALSETLTETVREDVTRFVPGGLTIMTPSAKEAQPPADGVDRNIEASIISPTRKTESKDGDDSAPPPYITQLQTLITVRDRLESVIKVFGEAMQWTIPPSEVSLTSSLISVSGPEPNSSDSHSREEKGREFAKKLREEIIELVTSTGGAGTDRNDLKQGHDAAMARIHTLGELAQIWKGTAEEKARVRFVESLAKEVDEKMKASEREAGGRKERNYVGVARGSVSTRDAPQRSNTPSAPETRGFLDNL
ncbi:hypothetical protein BDY21DRAFT_276583, partial [Lineolata rhizophorae]